MDIFTEIEGRVATLRALLGGDLGIADLAPRMTSLESDALVRALREAAGLTREIERISIIGAGVAAARSRDEAGRSGLAQSLGHRNPAAMMQDITGAGRAEAQRHVRLGTAVVAGATEAGDTAGDRAHDGSRDGADTTPWHTPLTAALLAARVSSAQHDAILRGLGEPPDDGATETWRRAAAHLVDEASERTVEELRQTARTMRDSLDPDGASRRFLERYERRSFRMWIDQDGVQHGHVAFDDEGATWMTAIRDAALRPRRGGPRFVDADERVRGEALTADGRSNDQLSYDLLIDVLRAGALADAESVFGCRQPGVRLVRVIDDETGAVRSEHTEDYLAPLPTAAVDQHICDSGTIDVTTDRLGNPLDVGREHRLFTPRQRLALAVRDGGCTWRGCDRPASYCEAHHIDEWSADHGCTDIDRGILLCRHHHMQLHHGGWRITRSGQDEFRLHPPGGSPPIVLHRRTALGYAWAGIDPPSHRFRPPAEARIGAPHGRVATTSTLKPSASSNHPA